MKKLFVNQEACIGCGACVAIDGEHFDFNDEGLSNVISNENIESDDAKNAISSCPTNAISYIESDCYNPNCTCDECSCEECDCDGSDCHCSECNK